jgi:hypothetical protein
VAPAFAVEGDDVSTNPDHADDGEHRLVCRRNFLAQAGASVDLVAAAHGRLEAWASHGNAPQEQPVGDADSHIRGVDYYAS